MFEGKSYGSAEARGFRSSRVSLMADIAITPLTIFETFSPIYPIRIMGLRLGRLVEESLYLLDNTINHQKTRFMDPNTQTIEELSMKNR